MPISLSTFESVIKFFVFLEKDKVFDSSLLHYVKEMNHDSKALLSNNINHAWAFSKGIFSYHKVMDVVIRNYILRKHSSMVDMNEQRFVWNVQWGRVLFRRSLWNLSGTREWAWTSDNNLHNEIGFYLWKVWRWMQLYRIIVFLGKYSLFRKPCRLTKCVKSRPKFTSWFMTIDIWWCPPKLKVLCGTSV